MNPLPLPASILRQLADDRLPRLPSSTHDTSPIRRASDLAGIESLELEPELRTALVRRVNRDRVTASSVISEALRQYLAPGA